MSDWPKSLLFNCRCSQQDCEEYSWTVAHVPLHICNPYDIFWPVDGKVVTSYLLWCCH